MNLNLTRRERGAKQAVVWKRSGVSHQVIGDGVGAGREGKASAILHGWGESLVADRAPT